MLSRRPGYHHGTDTIEINAGRPSVTMNVTNTGDRPVQIGSHFHFFEVNSAMRFPREQAWGMHLDIPAGSGVRFEPGETKQVTLVAFAGARRIVGFNGFVNGGLDAPQTKVEALKLLAERGYQDGADSTSDAAAKTTKTSENGSANENASGSEKGSK
ncbi:urease subunit beta [Microbacterium jiangjiandongii]|uniref:urease subunit beta n=1 Tax=Microbacterium jiangjiandongii TaxID=3049071 RepID=UPI00214B517A|nr:urease subunit beta [Microbacterium sp. zg.Y843]MCR2814846.1 urease subunit beta [Microbacterium sp. zg.Y843]